MSRLHLDPHQVRRFVEGDCDEAEAVRLAEHVDLCPACAAAVAAAEPLAPALDALEPPAPPPPALTREVVEAHARHLRHRGTTEPSVAAGLVAAAVAVLALLGAPAELWGAVQGLGASLWSVARSVDAPVALVTPVWAAAALFTFAAAAIAVRRLEAGGASWR